MAQTDSNLDKQPANPTGRAAGAPSAAAAGPGIGFNELRQACEISALREDITRLTDESDTLRQHIETRVDQVRSRVAGLCAEELADPDIMAPLLQFAVSALIAIRDHARGQHGGPGALDDAGRPDWSAGLTPPPPATEKPAAAPSRPEPPPPAPPAPPPPPRERPAVAPPRPIIPPPVAQPPIQPPPRPPAPIAPTPAPARQAETRAPATPPPGRPGSGSIDWLSPVRR